MLKNLVFVFYVVYKVTLLVKEYFSKLILIIFKKLIYRKIVCNHSYEINRVNNRIKGDDTIWTLWLQGLDEAPDLVKMCISSFSKIKGKKTVVLSESNLEQYIKLPVVIIEKYNRGLIPKAAYSEIIRLELLSTYGGLWLDATMYQYKENFFDYNEYNFFTGREVENYSKYNMFGTFTLFLIFCKENYQPIIN
uniref:capsular polysaccharide synthesis protein n=1 Tax=Rosenbergiella australiborealis TaxID=1544696 RepID=UPI001F4D6F29